MKTYVLSIAVTSLISALVILLTPDGKGGGIGKHIKLLTSLTLLSIIINPFLSFVKSLSGAEIDGFKDRLLDGTESIDPYEKIFYDKLSEMSADELGNELKTLIGDKFGIKKENIEVNAEYTVEENSVCFNRITVILSGGAIFKSPYDIESYVKEITGIECKCLL